MSDESPRAGPQNETGYLVNPKSKEDFQQEVKRVLDRISALDPAKIRCLVTCVIEVDDEKPDDDTDKVKATHMVIGTRVQLAAMLASTYSAIGRTFEAEQSAEGVKKESMQ